MSFSKCSRSQYHPVYSKASSPSDATGGGGGGGGDGAAAH